MATCRCDTITFMSAPDPSEVDRVLRSLLSDLTGDMREDLCAAGRELMRRRRENTYNGDVVFRALRAQPNPRTGKPPFPWEAIKDCTGVPTKTIRRWAQPPPEE